MITDREIAVLVAVSRYYTLNRQQIQRLVFPDDPDGRITRRRLRVLLDEQLINRRELHYTHPANGTPAPVYYPARKGCELLREHFDDDRFLRIPAKPPIPHHIWHWLAVAETHIVFDLAIAKLPKDSQVNLDAWINEYDEINGQESAPEKKYRLFTLLSEVPRLVCAPDAGLLLRNGELSKVYYLEQDRATSGVQQIANSKTGGYAAMAMQQLHRRHFPEATSTTFTVLTITPTLKRRDSLRRAIAEKPGASLWQFAAFEDVTPEKVLHHPIWYGCGSDFANSLVKTEVQS